MKRRASWLLASVAVAAALASGGCVVAARPVAVVAPARVWVPGYWASTQVWVRGHWRYR